MARAHLSNWALSLLAGADIPFSILLGLLGALRNGNDAEGDGEQLGMCVLKVLACVFAGVGGITAFCAYVYFLCDCGWNATDEGADRITGPWALHGRASGVFTYMSASSALGLS